MSDIVIRAAGEADIAKVTAIYADAVCHGTATFEIEPPDDSEMARRFCGLVSGGFPYLVAEVEGQVAGYCYAGPHHTRAAYRFTLEDSIYVAPSFHRRGIGRALLERLIAEASARNFCQMVAIIGDSANTASIALHRTAGFRHVGTFEAVGFKFGRWIDTVLMQRAIG